MTNDDQVRQLREVCDRHDADVFAFSGPMFRDGIRNFVDELSAIEAPRTNIWLFLTTLGGDPDAAFQMARAIKRHYRAVRLLVFGPCKSAGTLATLGANEIVMSNSGELGPLDVQTRKPDELMQLNSGLDIFEGLAVVSQQAFHVFENCFMDIVQKSGGSISAVTAAEIARKFTADLYSPITAQIDPLRVGELQRAIRIAEHYGARLGSPNVKPGAVDRLVSHYPSHTSVIDIEEAAKLFYEVRVPQDEEWLLSRVLAKVVSQPLSEPETINLTNELREASSQGEDDAGTQPEQGAGEDFPAPTGGRGEDGAASQPANPGGNSDEQNGENQPQRKQSRKGGNGSKASVE